MELCSKEAKLVGGIYSVLGAPFWFFKTEFGERADVFLFVVFVIAALMLYLPWFSRRVGKLFEKYPRGTAYLVAIGWLPFVMIIGVVAIPLSAVFFLWDELTIERVADGFDWLCCLGVTVALGRAYLKLKKNL